MNGANTDFLYPCPCCGYKVLFEKPPGTYLVCPICFWEDTDESLGILRIAQHNFLKFGACDRTWIEQVRCPTDQDQRLSNWQPLDILADQARPGVIEQVTRAFEDVSREDGITLHEARVIDNYGGDEERAIARELDTDHRWQDVPNAWIERFYNALSFVDAKGLRYYLPAFMCYSLKFYASNSAAVDWAIYTCILHNKSEELKKHILSKFSLLTVEQSRAICRFLQFKATYRATVCT